MKREFTLIDLIIVSMIALAIFAVVIAVAIPYWGNHQEKSRCQSSPMLNPHACRAGYLFDNVSGKQIISENGGGVPCGMPK